MRIIVKWFNAVHMEVLIHMDVLVHVSACIVIAVGKKTFFAMIYAHIMIR